MYKNGMQNIDHGSNVVQCNNVQKLEGLGPGEQRMSFTTVAIGGR